MAQKTEYTLKVRIGGAVDPSLNAAANKASSTLGAGLKNAGKFALGAATATAAAAGAALVGVGAYAVRVGSDFEAGMSEVRAISGASAADMEKLSAKAKEMGATTKFSATESAEALKYMAMAGWKTQQMTEGLPGIMNLAAASGESLGSVSDIVTDALTAFGLKASDSAHFADVLAKAASSSNTNVGMMGATFKYAAPVAGALGYSIEDTAVAIGMMANSGIKGEHAGTALRGMLTNLAKPSDQVAQYMDKLGIRLSDASGKVKPLNQLMDDLRKKFAGLTQEQQAEYAAGIAGKEAMSGLLAIVNTAPADYEKLTAEIANADGAAQSMADTMNDNLQGQMTLMKSNLEGVGIKIYDNLQGPLKNAVKVSNDSITEISDSLSGGELERSLTTISNGFGNLIESGAKLAAEVLPTIINGIAYVVDHGEQIADGLKAAAGVFVTFKAAAKMDTVVRGFKSASGEVAKFVARQGAAATAGKVFSGSLTAGQTAVGVLTGKIGMATATQGLFSSVLAASPFLLVAGGALALGAAVWAVKAASAESRRELDENNETLKEMQKHLNDVHDSQKRLSDQTAESIGASEAQIRTTQAYVDELQTYLDKNGKVEDAHKVRADYLTDEINKLIPGAIEKLDDEAGAHYKIKDSIEAELLAKRKAMAIDAMQGEFNEASQNRGESYQTLTKYRIEQGNIQQQVDRQQQLFHEIQSASEALANGSDAYASIQISDGTVINMGNAAQELDNVSAKHKALNDQLGEAADKVQQARQEYEHYDSVISNFNTISACESAEEFDKAIARVGDTTLKTANSNRDTLLQEVADRQVTYAQRKINLQQALKSEDDTIRADAQQKLNEAKTRLDDAVTLAREGGENISDEIVNGVATGEYSYPAAIQSIIDAGNVKMDAAAGTAYSKAARIMSEFASGLKKGAGAAAQSVVNGIADVVNSAFHTSTTTVKVIPSTDAAPPKLASGGITTGPTMAMIGEGEEQEAVLPLSKLDALLGRSEEHSRATEKTSREENVTFAPVQNFYGPADAEAVQKANEQSFEQFEAMYRRMREDERRASFSMT